MSKFRQSTDRNQISNSLTIETFGMSGEWKTRFETSAGMTCVIDSKSTIVYCNPAWDYFARRNDGERATSSYVVGHAYLAYIPEVLLPRYRQLITNATVERAVCGEDYEGRSAQAYYRYRLTLLPIPGTSLVAMVHSVFVERAVPQQPMRASEYHHGPGKVVTMCAQCRRTRRNPNHHWDWVPEFVKTAPRRVSHGICPECTMLLYA
jgi:hypothetical protein